VRRGDLNAAVRDRAIEAATIMREVADDQVLAQTLHLTGLLAWVEDGAWEHAVRLVEEGRSLAATAGAAGVVASATHMLGVIALMRGAAQDAEIYLGETLGLLDRLPADLPPFFSAVTPGCFWELGPGGQPRVLFTETVLLYRRVGPGQAAAYTLSNLAYAARLAGEPARARTLVEQSLSAFDRLGDLHGEGVALCHLANLHRHAGELSEAGELLGRSLELRRRLGDRRGVGLTVASQGLVAGAAGDLGRADRLLREAFLLFEEMEDGPGRWGALLDLGLVLLDAGEDDRARRVLRQWRELPVIVWGFRPRAWTLLSLAVLERRAGDQTTAADCVEEARRRFVALADAPGLTYLTSHAEPLLSAR
jgi:tetratricopeptide (TPR) repeat protein